MRYGLIDLRRNPVLIVLLIVVPAVFVLLAKATTPARFLVMTIGTSHNAAWVGGLTIAAGFALTRGSPAT